FVNSSPASFLLPTKDTGVQAWGTAAGGALEYNIALVDGAVAGSAGDDATGSGKDVVVRVFARPCSGSKLGIGLGVSYGDHEGPALPVLRTYGGEVFFSYRPQSVARGPVLRVAPHLVWAHGPVGLHAEAVRTRERVRGAVVDGWAFSAVPTLVLTGENAAP